MTKRIISILSLVLILAVCLMSTTSCLLVWEGLKELGNQGNETPDDGGETPDDGGETPDDGGETPDDGGETPEGPGEGGEGGEQPPHEHNFVDGRCECGEEDPNYVPPHVNTLAVGPTNKIVVNGETLNDYGYPIEWVAFYANSRAHYEFVGDNNALAFIFSEEGAMLCGGTGKADLDEGYYLICVGNGAVGEFNVAVTQSEIVTDEPGEGGEGGEVTPPAHVNTLAVGDTNKIVVSGETLNQYGLPVEWVSFVVTEKAHYEFVGDNGALVYIFDSNMALLCGGTGKADLDVGTYSICLGNGVAGEFNVVVTKSEIVTEEPGEGGEGGEVTPPAHVNTLVVGDTNKIVVSGNVQNTAGLPIEWVAFTADEKAHYEFIGDTGVACLIFDTNYTLICGGTGKADLEAGSYLICVGNGLVGEFNVAVTKSAIPPAEVKPIVNVSDLATGTTTDAELIAGTGISASAGLTIEANGKSIDGFEFTNRLKFSGAMKVADGVVTNGVKIVTKGPSSIIVYAIAGNSSATDRFLQVATLADNTFTQVDITDTYVDGAAIAKYVFTVEEAGTYYLGSTKSGINLYYIAVESHEHSYKSVVTAPTCTDAGYTTYTCDCGKSYKADDVAALGHTNAAAVEENKVDSTCSVAGSYDSVVYCSVCEVEVSREAKTIDKKAHTEVDDAAVAPDCENTGLTAGKHCSVCNEVLVAQNEVAALGHTEATDAGTAADCDSTGLTEGKHCSVCNEVLVEQTTIPALGHKDENSDYICDVCEVKLCTDHTEETIPAVAATCTATGLTEGKKCSTCGEILEAQEETVALGHNMIVDAAKAATCTETGLTEGSHCSRCDHKVAQEETPALGHTAADAVVENEVAATCKAAGSYDSVVKCSVCTAEMSRTPVTVDKLSHTEAIDAAVAATCTTAGKTEGKHCSVCNEVLVAQEEVAALGHSYNDGKCSGCGDEKADYNPLVMNFSNFVAYGTGTYTDGLNQVYNEYFTFIHSSKSRVEANEKTFSDGFAATNRFDFGGKTDSGKVPTKSAIKITTTGAMTLKLWWVSGGNDRLPFVLDAEGTKILEAAESTKNGLYITEFALPAAGTYYLGNTATNYWFKLELVPIDESHVHVWSDATCKELSKCSCGATQGELADHTPGDAATCTTAQTCTVCDEKLVAALGHNYVNGVCDREGCGAEEPAGGETPETPAATAQVHSFTANGTTDPDGFFTFAGSTGKKGDVVYDNLTLTTCLKMSSSASVSFTPTADGKVTLVFNSSCEGYTIYINGGNSTAIPADGIITLDVTAGTSYTITKNKSESFLYYIVYTPNA